MVGARLPVRAIYLLWLLVAGYPMPGAARDTYFTPNCGSCHAVAAPTCNGCHVHGTHPNYDGNSVKTQNLKVTTDKTTYVEGDTITLTLEGGNMPDFKGWVGARVYDSSGVEVTRKQAQLGCNPSPTQFGNKCDLPMKLSVPAKLGWTQLYASWAGNQYDRSGAKFGAVLTSMSFGIGQRALVDGNGNQVANHLEEIVVTGKFTVTAAPQPAPAPAPTPIPTPTPTPEPTPVPDTGADQPQAPAQTSSTNDADSGTAADNTNAPFDKKAAAGSVDASWFVFALLLGVWRARALKHTLRM